MNARGIAQRSIYGTASGISGATDVPTETPTARMVGGSALSRVSGQAFSGASDITSGRMSLAALEVIVAGLIVFYVWTRNVQGGG